MSDEVESLVIVAAILGIALAIYTSQKATQVAQAAQNPLQTIGNEIENWFAHLWGDSPGGTPEATS